MIFGRWTERLNLGTSSWSGFSRLSATSATRLRRRLLRRSGRSLRLLQVDIDDEVDQDPSVHLTHLFPGIEGRPARRFSVHVPDATGKLALLCSVSFVSARRSTNEPQGAPRQQSKSESYMGLQHVPPPRLHLGYRYGPGR